MRVEKDLLKILEKLKSVKGITGAMLFTKEGLPIKSILPDNIDDLEFAAMNAALVGSAQTIIQSIDKGDKHPDSILLNGNHSRLMYYMIKDSVVILVLATPLVKTSLILTKLKKIANEVIKLMKL